MTNIARPAVVLAATLLGFAAGTSAQAQNTAAEEPPPIEIVRLETSGAGCPIESIQALPSAWGPNMQAFTITLDQFEAEVTKNVASKVVDCLFRVYLKTKQGTKAALASATYHGKVKLDAGVRARLQSAYYWSGKPIVATSKTPTDYLFTTPYEDDFKVQDEVSVPAWTDCGSNQELDIQTYLSIRNNEQTPGRGSMRVLQTDIQVESSVKRDTAAIVLEFWTNNCGQGFPPR